MNDPNERARQKKGLLFLRVFAVLCVVFLCARLVYLSVLAPVVDADVRTELTALKHQAQEDATVAGVFYDRNGVPLTRSGGPGEEGTLLYPESTSFLLGYHNDRFGSSGLRSSCADTLYLEGRDVALTLDIRLQETAWRLLPPDASAIILDNRTGEILCLAGRSTVDFDANALESSLEAANRIPGSLLPRGFSEADPPGSTMKIFSAAAALEKERQSPGSIRFEYQDTAPFQVPGSDMEIHNWDDGSWGTLSLRDAFVHSSNTYFAQLAVQVGADDFGALLERAGFGQSIPLDFCTVTSHLGPLEELPELVQTSFGQGEVTICPLQLAAAVSAFFQDGVMMVPHLLKETGASVFCDAVCAPETAELVRELMVEAAESYGLTEETTGTVLGAKTGTAQCAGRLHTYLVAGDSERTYLLSFNNGETSTELYDPMRQLVAYTTALDS